MGRILRDSELIGEPRHRHVDNVVPLHRPARVNPSHPSLFDRPDVFDQDDPDVNAASECVLLTMVEAQAIAGVLRHARGHCPSPGALDEAIALLTEGAGRCPSIGGGS